MPSVIVVARRPELGAPAASGASTSTSTTSPGTTTEEPAGVPVRITSPVSRVSSCERSATRRPKGNSRVSLESSCTSSPFTQVRTRRAAGSTEDASIRSRSERREAVAALRAHVRSAVGGSQVVQAEVVRRGDGCHVLPAVVGGDAPRGLADDERDLALEGEQLGARGAFERLAGCRERRRGLEEVARLGRRSPPLRGARGVVEVHGDDLAGSDAGDGHGRPRLLVCEIIYDLA